MSNIQKSVARGKEKNGLDRVAITEGRDDMVHECAKSFST